MSNKLDPGQSRPATVGAFFENLIASWVVGGLVVGGVAMGLVVLAVALLFAALFVSVAGKWLLWFALAAAVAGIFFYDMGRDAPAQAASIRRRMAGIHGDACYATLEETRERGLIPASFTASVYLGEFLDWFIPDNKRFEPTGWHLGYAGPSNILTVAPSRSGKLTTAIAQTMVLCEESTFVLDPKGEVFAISSRHRAERLGHRVIALNPFNLFGDMLGLTEPLTDGYNPLAALDAADPNFTTNIDALAAAMIVQEGNDPHWPNRARDLVACLMAHVCSDPDELAAGTNHLPRIRQLLGLPREELAAYMEGARANPLPRVQNLAGGFNDPTSKEIGSIISTAIGQLAFLDHPQIAAFLSRSTFDFRALRRAPTTIYLMIPPTELNTYFRFARLMVQACFNTLTVEPVADDRRVLMLLDEQAQLKNMEVIVNGIALLNGYRVRIWSVFQDLNQLKGIYGDRWESFISNAGVVQVFTPNDETTAKYFSDKIGNYTGVSASENSGTSTSTGGQHATSNASSGVSFNPAAVPLISVQDFYRLPDTESILFVRGSDDPVPARKTDYWKQPAFNGMTMPNPYHDADGFRRAWHRQPAPLDPFEQAVAEERPFSLLPSGERA